MTSPKPKNTSNSVSTSGASAMLPRVLRPCCRGRLLRVLASGIVLSAVVFYVIAFLPLDEGEFVTSNSNILKYFTTQSRIKREDKDLTKSISGNKDGGSLVGLDLSKHFEGFHAANKTGDSESPVEMFKSKLQKATLAMRESVKAYEEEISSIGCFRSLQNYRDVSLEKVTVIYTLVGIESVLDAALLLQVNIDKLPETFTGDIVVTSETSAPRKYKRHLEEIVDMCSLCRLFFLEGTIWEHRNAAANFAHGNILVFVDVRTTPLGVDWLPPIVETLSRRPMFIVSPQVRLRSEEHGRDFSAGIARNEIMWNLGAIRAAVRWDEAMRAMAAARNLSTSGPNSNHVKFPHINHTAIFKEVVAVQKKYFQYLGGFDTVAGATGGEQVLFSLKVLSCGGNIALSFCSAVSLAVPSDHTSQENQKLLKEAVASQQQQQHLKASQHRLDVIRGNPSTNLIMTEFLRRQSAEAYDFLSPSFFLSAASYSSYTYRNTVSNLWLDSSTKLFFSCTEQPRLQGWTVFPPPPLKHGTNRWMGRPEPDLTKHIAHVIRDKKGFTGNFLNLIRPRQQTLMSPIKHTQSYGFIRSLDGLFAVGISPARSPHGILAAFSQKFSNSLTVDRAEGSGKNQSHADQVSGSFDIILTRNSSEWLGPFFYIKGSFVYLHLLCLTLTPANSLSLQKCVKGTKEQIFVFKNSKIKPAGVADEYACAKRHIPSSRAGAQDSVNMKLSSPIVFSSCLDTSSISDFKMDVKFTDGCIT